MFAPFPTHQIVSLLSNSMPCHVDRVFPVKTVSNGAAIGVAFIICTQRIRVLVRMAGAAMLARGQSLGF